MQYIFIVFTAALGIFGWAEMLYIYLFFYSIRRCRGFKEFKEIVDNELSGVMKKTWFFVATQLVIIVSFIGMIDCIGNTQIGSFFEKRNYEEDYYVFVNYDDDNNNNKYYKQKATINRREGDDKFFSCSYYLDKIYFENHTSKFYDDELSLNEEVIVWDYSTDKELRVILTNKKFPKAKTTSIRTGSILNLPPNKGETPILDSAFEAAAKELKKNKKATSFTANDIMLRKMQEKKTRLPDIK